MSKWGECAVLYGIFLFGIFFSSPRTSTTQPAICECVWCFFCSFPTMYHCRFTRSRQEVEDHGEGGEFNRFTHFSSDSDQSVRSEYGTDVCTFLWYIIMLIGLCVVVFLLSRSFSLRFSTLSYVWICSVFIRMYYECRTFDRRSINLNTCLEWNQNNFIIYSFYTLNSTVYVSNSTIG